MKELEITKIIDGAVRGSSRPIIAETSKGRHLIKLRGSSQGCGALIAEVIVTEIAKALNLNVLPISYARLRPDTPTDDKNDELADLLKASCGLNIALPLLEGARDITNNDLIKLTRGEKAATLWLDRFVMNPDRNEMNPNLLFHRNNVFLIDHGASLRFQYKWSKVTEFTPQEVGLSYKPHIFEELSNEADWRHWDDLFSKNITRDTLQRAVQNVPNDFIEDLEPKLFLNTNSKKQRLKIILRRKEAYIAFLWKRIKPPRNFALYEVKFRHFNSDN